MSSSWKYLIDLSNKMGNLIEARRKEDERKRKKAIEKTRALMIESIKKEYEFLKDLKKKYEK